VTGAASTTSRGSLEITAIAGDPFLGMRLDLGPNPPVSYSFDLELVELPAAGPLTADLLEIQCGAANEFLLLRLSRPGASASAAPTLQSFSSRGAPSASGDVLPLGTWKRLTVVIEAGASSVVVDGKKDTVLHGCPSPTSVKLGLRVVVGSPWKIRFDHVVFSL